MITAKEMGLICPEITVIRDSGQIFYVPKKGYGLPYNTTRRFLSIEKRAGRAKTERENENK